MSDKRKPFTLRERRRWSQDFGNRARIGWGAGDLPAPFAAGDVVELIDAFPDDESGYNRLRGQVGPFFVVTYGPSIGEDDSWYFRVYDGQGESRSDRLHVIPGACDYMAPFRLVETADPEGLALRDRMLADGWSPAPPQTHCAACGQPLPAVNGGDAGADDATGEQVGQ